MMRETRKAVTLKKKWYLVVIGLLIYLCGISVQMLVTNEEDKDNMEEEEQQVKL